LNGKVFLFSDGRCQYSGDGRAGWVRGVMVFVMADEEKKGALRELVRAESMIQLAIALPAACVIGWLVGAWLDRHFNQHWIGIVGIVLGAVGGFIQIVTMASRYLKKGD
jgi:F0F1-type ATP synthase assembly protein I